MHVCTSTDVLGQYMECRFEFKFKAKQNIPTARQYYWKWSMNDGTKFVKKKTNPKTPTTNKQKRQNRMERNKNKIKQSQTKQASKHTNRQARKRQQTKQTNRETREGEV